MGTRNLTMVKLYGELKVAQYGQWDGYPTGQGKTIATFLHSAVDLEKFEKQVAKLKWATKKDIKDSWVKSGADPKSDSVTFDISDKHAKYFPSFSRDTGAEILGLIALGKVNKVVDESEFLNDSLFCEWAYCLDLDKKVVEVYRGFQKIGPDEYGPAKLLKKIPFSKFTPESMEKLTNDIDGEDE